MKFHYLCFEAVQKFSRSVTLTGRNLRAVGSKHTQLTQLPLLSINPLTTDDVIWRRLTLAACYQLVNLF